MIRRILEIADLVGKPELPHKLHRIQIDELHTFIQNKGKEICVIYSWSQELKQVLSLTVGTRSKTNLRLVVNPLLGINLKSINTDGYSGYRGALSVSGILED